MSRDASCRNVDDGVVLGGIGWMKAACTLAMTAVGVGILALPGTAVQAGWLGSVIGLFIASLIIFYNNHLLWRTLSLVRGNESGDVKCYEDAGGSAFGVGGSVYFGVILHTALILVCSVMILLLAATTETLTQVLSRRIWTAIWTAISISLALIRDMKHVGSIAAVGAMSASVMVIVIIAACISKLATDGVSNEVMVMPQKGLKFISVFATYFFAYGLSTVTPTVYHGMANPSDFPKALSTAIFFCLCLYTSTLELGYLAYSQSLASADTVLAAISPPNQPLTIFGWLINIIVIVVVLSHILVLFTPTAKRVDMTWSAISERRRWSTFQLRVCLMASRTLLIILEGCIAIAVPKVDVLVGLIGAFCVTQLSVFFPIACYVKLKRRRKISIPLWETLLFMLLVAVASLVMVMGIYGASLQF
ncbi:hypothetical protein FOL47_006765 [Perkinsus chesapeaki]|uniref:Amino acid transporter transmembrane domain-containing protein n=1 Tax=Perkinsus chesapeaki TaxID=330153 RepID=A0A7J6LPW1_PERCH|nr:hypothetical protein FOL47_006765 [Perkinsus chesapeaki]